MSDRLAFKQSITKKAFVAKLQHDFGEIQQCPYTEGSPPVRMTLYYNVVNKHLGTWQGGTGWIFTSAYNSVTA